MGWKNVKEHYRIGHIVRVEPSKGICIGSDYIHDLIVIGLDGTIKKCADNRVNADLIRYVDEMKADPAKLKELVESPDTFKKSLVIYTYAGGTILEKFCEEYLWPNVTHDGDMMFENCYSKNKNIVIGWALENAARGIKWRGERIEELKEETATKIAELELAKKQCEFDLAKLKNDYPKSVVNF